MKTLTILIAIVIISSLLQSCKKESGKIILTDDYLPLEVGNYWQLDYTDKEEII
jgi:hypothetical protein